MSDSRFPLRGSQSLRGGRHSEPGRIYFVTFATRNREPLFTCWNLALNAIRTFCEPTVLRDARLLCWVLMPDHWHGLVELGEHEALSRLIRRIKGTSARVVNAAAHRQAAIWSEGFYDHAVREDEDLVQIARYIVLNPVRAGLVERIGCYPYWDAIWLNQQHRG